jgi:5-methylcytosine-specific restriction endonuclease McrA
MKVEIKQVKLSEIKLNRRMIYACKECGTEFTTKKACKSRTPVYCSVACYLKAVTKYAGATFTCQQCGIDFKTDSAYRGRIPKYCSIRCFGESKKGSVPWNAGMIMPDTHRKAMSEGRKKSPKCKGPNLYNWRGGEATFKDRSRVYQNNRRARETSGGPLNPVFLQHLWDAHKGLCFYCEKPLTEYRCLEHLTPLTRGGNNKPFNLVYSCKSCNSKKRQMSLEDYAITSGRIWLVDKWEDVFIHAYGQTTEARCNTAN